MGMYILKGKETIYTNDIDEWLKGLQDETRILKRENIGDILISTIFLGLNHDLFSEIPILFETMAFKDGKTIEMKRYSTYDEAVEGHERIKRNLTKYL